KDAEIMAAGREELEKGGRMHRPTDQTRVGVVQLDGQVGDSGIFLERIRPRSALKDPCLRPPHPKNPRLLRPARASLRRTRQETVVASEGNRLSVRRDLPC